MPRFRVTRRFDAYVTYSAIVEAEDEDAAAAAADLLTHVQWSDEGAQQFDDYDETIALEEGEPAPAEAVEMTP